MAGDAGSVGWGTARAGRAAEVRRHGSRIGAPAAIRSGWQVPLNPDHPVEPLPPEGVAALHDGAMRILSEIGIRFQNDEALAVFRGAGCIVRDDLVRMDAAFVVEMLRRCPAEFAITPRNPDRRVPVGGRALAFGSVSSPPHYRDLETGRVPGFMAGFRNLLILAQHFDCIHFVGGYPVEPADIPAATRHLDCLQDMLLLTDKVVHAYALGEGRVEDALQMIRIAAGLTPEAFRAAPRTYTNINAASPLKHDRQMIDGALRCARAGQAVMVTPVTLAGATAPVTLAGAVALSVAEALSAIALIQMVVPGAPCIFGTFTSNVDLSSGAPAFGTPDNMRAAQMAGQMARFYGLPLRGSGACSANVPDGQSMWETSNALWSAVQSGANMVYHAAGWLEGGQTASPEKFVLDCEMLTMIQRYLQPGLTAAGPEEIALDVIAEVGPGGHFLGHPHTQGQRAAGLGAGSAAVGVSDRRSIEAWQADGGIWTAERAHLAFKAVLADHRPPPMDPAIREELAAFVTRRKAEGGAAD